MWWFDAIDYSIGLFVGFCTCRQWYVPVLPVKVTQLLPDLVPSTNWADTVRPVVGKLVVGAEFGASVTFNPVGSKALGKLIEEMATKLDIAVTLQKADLPKEPLTTTCQPAINL